MYTVHVASELIDNGNSKNEERKNPRGTGTEKSKQINKQIMSMVVRLTISSVCHMVTSTCAWWSDTW